MPTSRRNFRARLMSAMFGGPRAADYLQRTQQQLDTRIYRLTKGRHTIASIGAGFDVVVLTTIGAKSKQPREVVLAALPYHGGFLIIGSNFGRPKHPAWVHNLRAHPDVLAEMRGYAAQVHATELKGIDRERGWNYAVERYPAFANYKPRAAPRVIALFVLHPTRLLGRVEPRR